MHIRISILSSLTLRSCLDRNRRQNSKYQNNQAQKDIKNFPHFSPPLKSFPVFIAEQATMTTIAMIIINTGHSDLILNCVTVSIVPTSKKFPCFYRRTSNNDNYRYDNYQHRPQRFNTKLCYCVHSPHL